MFNKLASDASLLNKSSDLVAASGVTILLRIIKINLVPLCCYTYIQFRCSKPKDQLLNSSLALALGVAKYIIVTGMILVTLCCATLVRLRCAANPLQWWVCLTEAPA
jgi:hypothetical protein